MFLSFANVSISFELKGANCQTVVSLGYHMHHIFVDGLV